MSLAVRHRPATARLIARRTRGLLILTDREAAAGTPTLDVCPETDRARVCHRHAEEIFEERPGYRPTASPRPMTSRIWKARRFTASGAVP
ncbi:hypothetical protein [Streptomyces sp. NPDC053728]|uniref:hypothetical protein n=1 Tax=Streptomyces sp. NPDC053728 TaxID=3155534 RepID=UPI0034410A47